MNAKGSGRKVRGANGRFQTIRVTGWKGFGDAGFKPFVAGNYAKMLLGLMLLLDMLFIGILIGSKL